MLLKTRRNGGGSSLQEVADAWKKEDHDFGWSQSGTDKWSVEFAQELKAAQLKAGSAVPDPRNIHED